VRQSVPSDVHSLSTVFTASRSGYTDTTSGADSLRSLALLIRSLIKSLVSLRDANNTVLAIMPAEAVSRGTRTCAAADWSNQPLIKCGIERERSLRTLSGGPTASYPA